MNLKLNYSQVWHNNPVQPTPQLHWKPKPKPLEKHVALFKHGADKHPSKLYWQLFPVEVEVQIQLNDNTMNFRDGNWN